MSEEITNYETAVSKVRVLMSDFLSRGVDLFVFLRKVDTAGVWRDGGHANFQDFLEAVAPGHWLSFDRYTSVINAINVYGEERVRQVGIECCHALLEPKVVRDDGARQVVTASIDEHISTHGAPPTRHEVRRIVAGVVGKSAPQATSTRKVMRESETATTIRELKEQLKEAHSKIRSLERENKRLKTKLDRAA